MNMIRYDFRRCLGNGKALLVFLALVLLLLVSQEDVVTGMLRNQNSAFYDVVSIFHHAVSFDRFRSIIILALSALYTAAIGDDLRSHYMHQVLGRISLKKYVCSKVLVNACSIMLTFFLAVTCYVLILFRLYPLADADTIERMSSNFMMYESFPILQHPMGMIYCQALVLALSVILLTTAGMLLSTYVQDSFVSYGFPYVLNFFLMSVTYFFPDKLYFMSFSNAAYVFLEWGWLGNWLWKCGVNLALTTAVALLLYRELKKRWYHEE